MRLSDGGAAEEEDRREQVQTERHDHTSTGAGTGPEALCETRKEPLRLLHHLCVFPNLHIFCFFIHFMRVLVQATNDSNVYTDLMSHIPSFLK